jgi:hypothetical protein
MGTQSNQSRHGGRLQNSKPSMLLAFMHKSSLIILQRYGRNHLMFLNLATAHQRHPRAPGRKPWADHGQARSSTCHLRRFRVSTTAVNNRRISMRDPRGRLAPHNRNRAGDRCKLSDLRPPPDNSRLLTIPMASTQPTPSHETHRPTSRCRITVHSPIEGQVQLRLDHRAWYNDLRWMVYPATQVE